MQVFFSAVYSGLKAFNSTDDLQRVLFYNKIFVLCILDFLLYDVTQIRQQLWPTVSLIADCQLASQFSTNRVDEDLFLAKVPTFD